MNTLWTSKTFYLGLLAIAGGLIIGLFDGDWSGAAEKIMAGMALITVRHAIAKGK